MARTSAELALIERAKAYKTQFNYQSWTQDAHVAFLSQEIKGALDLDGPDAKKVYDLVSMIGLGGNASQFSQACEFRVPKAEKAKGNPALDALFAPKAQA